MTWSSPVASPRRPGEVHLAGRQPLGDRAPALDELLVQGVPLVVVGVEVLEPVPLQDRRLEQRGGGVRVVLQHLARPAAVVAQVEAAVDVRVVPLPRRRDGLPAPLGQREVAEPLGRHDVVDGLQAHRVQQLDVRLEGEDLVHREHVVHRLVPVGPLGAALAAAGRVVDQALLGDRLVPARARGSRPALHPLSCRRSCCRRSSTRPSRPTCCRPSCCRPRCRWCSWRPPGRRG